MNRVGDATLSPVRTATNQRYERTGLFLRTNPVASFCALLLGLTLGVTAQEVEETTGEPEPEPVWRLEDGKIFRNEVVFVESGLDAPQGVIAGKNGSVIVAQRSELTQIFDEDGDGKGDFFRALITGLPAGDAIRSGPMLGSKGEIFVMVDRGGQAVDLIAWTAESLKTRLVISLPKEVGRIAIDENDTLAAVIGDENGVWIGLTSLVPPAPVAEPAKDAPIRATPVAASSPVLEPAVRIPNVLLGEGNGVSALNFAEGGGFLMTISDGRVLKVGIDVVAEKTQGGVFWHPGEATPFVIRDIKIVTDGFEVSLSKPADRGVVTTEPLPFQILVGKLVGNDPLEEVSIVRAAIEPDGMTITLIPRVLGPERLYVFDLSALKSEEGAALAAEKVAYTVIRVPEPTVVPPVLEAEFTDATIEPKPEEPVVEEKPLEE